VKDRSCLVKKEVVQNKAKKRRSLSYITNFLPIIEIDEKAKNKSNHSIKTSGIEKVISDPKVEDDYQIEENEIESISNEQPENTLIVKTFKR
jgi:hypothetical protein